jgi:hypothetical protein
MVVRAPREMSYVRLSARCDDLISVQLGQSSDAIPLTQLG